MNPPNKHVPILVFLIGAGCLIYSMATFFHPKSRLAARAPVPLPRPEAPESEPQKIDTPIPKAPPPPTPGEPPAYSPDWLTQQNEHAQKIAKGHLSGIGLDLTIPDNVQIGETADGPYKILLGASGGGRIGLFLFSTKGKITPEKLHTYIQDFFKNDLKLQPNGKGTPYNSRGGMQMTMFKGFTAKGDEYVAYAFRNGGSGQSHIVLLTDKELSRHPAKVRSLIDSIKSAR